MRKALMLSTVVTSALATGVWQAPAPISFAAAERIRLRAHFDSVERELRARDVSGLTPAQRAARAGVLNILHTYQVRGVFPRNSGSPRGDCAVAGAVYPASDGYKVATGVSVATNVATFTLNVLHTGLSRQASGIASVGAGTIGIIAGASNLGTSGPRGTLGLLNTGIGAASLALGAVRLIGTGHAGTPSPVSLAPWFGTRSTGLAARVEF